MREDRRRLRPGQPAVGAGRGRLRRRPLQGAPGLGRADVRAARPRLARDDGHAVRARGGRFRARVLRRGPRPRRLHVHERHHLRAEGRRAEPPRRLPRRGLRHLRLERRRGLALRPVHAVVPHGGARARDGRPLSRRDARAHARLRSGGPARHDRARAHLVFPRPADDDSRRARDAGLRAPRPVEPRAGQLRDGADARRGPAPCDRRVRLRVRARLRADGDGAADDRVLAGRPAALPRLRRPADPERADGDHGLRRQPAAWRPTMRSAAAGSIRETSATSTSRACSGSRTGSRT